MFRSSSPDPSQDPKSQQLLALLARDLFEGDRSPASLDFATIERRAHEFGQKVARTLCERIASDQAETTDQPQPCPECSRPCPSSIQTRELLTRDGPILLKELRLDCPHCRRAFFPQSNVPAVEPPPVQPGGPDHRSHHGNGRTLVRGSGQAAGDHRGLEGLASPPPDPLPGSRRRTRR